MIIGMLQGISRLEYAQFADERAFVDALRDLLRPNPEHTPSQRSLLFNHVRSAMQRFNNLLDDWPIVGFGLDQEAEVDW
jgi:hypothetical protein